MANDKDKTEKTQEYTLKVGSHTWTDGVTYVAGDPSRDKMQLTKDQMERIGKERFQDQTPEVANATIDSLTEEVRQLKAKLAELQGEEGNEESAEVDHSDTDYSDILSRSVPDIAAYLQGVNDVAALNAIQAEESKGGQPRVGVLKAINQRREELGNG